MAVEEPAQSLKLGDRVKIRYTNNQTGRIVELRGPLGPGGAQIYRIRIKGRVKPTYAEVRGDQLEIIPNEQPGSN